MRKKNKSTKIKKCRFCLSTFESLNDYLKHIETEHSGKQKKCFMCSVCGKQYKTKSELTQHINSKCGTIKLFKCKVCAQELMSAGSLYNHMLRHKGDRSYMCRFCAKLFFTAGQLKVHERIHTQDRAYVCDVCNKGFCHRQSLITHSTLHTGIKPYQCENCGNSFSCVGNLMKHRKTHADTCGLVPLTTHRVKHPSTKIKVKINTPATSRLKTKEKSAELEKELTSLKTELDKDVKDDPQQVETVVPNIVSLVKEVSGPEHNNVNNNEKEDKPEGDPDDKNEKNYNSLKTEEVDIKDESQLTEVENHNEGDNDPHLSDNGYDTSTKTDSEEDDNGNANIDNNAKINNKVTTRSNKHIKRDPKYEKSLHEFLGKLSFNKDGYGDCKYCGKRYMNLRWFYKHVKNHEKAMSNGTVTNPNGTLHKCSCCKESFCTKEDSLHHQQIAHADVLTCQDCEKLFANRDSLRSHQKIFHMGVSRKMYMYICDKCGKQFKQKSLLKHHVERNCDKGPFFECSICKKQFSSKHTRNNHMRIHDAQKKLLCQYCNKSFHWKGQLKIHERSHTGEKPFACLYCPKAFAYRESLITHSTIHTGIKPHLCEGCGSRFSCIGNLIKHRSNHASECGAWTYRTQQPGQETGNS